MTAGRELDVLVHERVMDGLKPFGGPGMTGFYVDSVPHYSTSIADAWEVLEKFPEVQRLEKRWPGEEPPGWWCEVGIDGGSFAAIGETAPLAICLAALKAVGA